MTFGIQCIGNGFQHWCNGYVWHYAYTRLRDPIETYTTMKMKSSRFNEIINEGQPKNPKDRRIRCNVADAAHRWNENVLWKLCFTDLESKKSSSRRALPLLISHDALLPGQLPIPGRNTAPVLFMRAARGSCPNDEVMCQCMPIFQAKGPKIWTWRTLHVEKPADEPVDLWIREIKNNGEICWNLI